MPRTMTFLPETSVVKSVYSGVVPPEVVIQGIHEALAFARAHGVSKFLTDCSALEAGAAPSDLYQLAELLAGVGGARGLREAIVLPHLKQAATDIRFWETTCRNRGVRIQIVKTVEEGEAWLAAQKTPSVLAPVS